MGEAFIGRRKGFLCNAIGHDWNPNDSQDYNDSVHFYKCVRCGIPITSTEEEHVMGEWESETYGDGTIAATHERWCTYCFYREVEDHDEIVDEVVAATCTKIGLTEGKHCSVCNVVLVEQKEVDALGHDDSGDWQYEWSDDHKSCTVYKVCQRCGEKLYEHTDSLKGTDDCGYDHEPLFFYKWINNESHQIVDKDDYVIIEAEDHIDEDEDYICDLCFKEIPEPECEHSWIAATCTEPKTCEWCGETEGEPLGHTEGDTVVENEVDNTCTEEGSLDEVVYCQVCGEELSRTEITLPPLDHPDSTPATCTEGEICNLCGEPLAPALGHDYECVVEGIGDQPTVYECSRCGDTYEM